MFSGVSARNKQSGFVSPMLMGEKKKEEMNEFLGMKNNQNDKKVRAAYKPRRWLSMSALSIPDPCFQSGMSCAALEYAEISLCRPHTSMTKRKKTH
jgi:hypothetical protein